eukprot:1815714-Amphidinium_carterae.1
MAANESVCCGMWPFNCPLLWNKIEGGSGASNHTPSYLALLLQGYKYHHNIEIESTTRISHCQGWNLQTETGPESI